MNIFKTLQAIFGFSKNTKEKIKFDPFELSHAIRACPELPFTVTQQMSADSLILLEERFHVGDVTFGIIEWDSRFNPFFTLTKEGEELGEELFEVLRDLVIKYRKKKEIEKKEAMTKAVEYIKLAKSLLGKPVVEDKNTIAD